MCSFSSRSRGRGSGGIGRYGNGGVTSRASSSSYTFSRFSSGSRSRRSTSSGTSTFWGSSGYSGRGNGRTGTFVREDGGSRRMTTFSSSDGAIGTFLLTKKGAAREPVPSPGADRTPGEGKKITPDQGVTPAAPVAGRVPAVAPGVATRGAAARGRDDGAAAVPGSKEPAREPRGRTAAVDRMGEAGASVRARVAEVATGAAGAQRITVAVAGAPARLTGAVEKATRERA